MIGKLSGTVFCESDHIIVDVNGVGYLVYCSTKSLHHFINGQYYQLIIETHVREDHIHLYGFLSNEEKQYFNLLQLVSGIGARMALTILSYLSPSQIQLAISRHDDDAFKLVPGVGKRLAERIIVDLKDKLSFSVCVADIAISNNLQNIEKDGISALSNLGINKIEAQSIIRRLLLQNPHISIDELIRLALQSSQ